MPPSVPSHRRPMPAPQLLGSDLRLLDSRPGPWVAEVKYDGWRGLLDTGSGRLRSRHGTDLTAAFPEVMAAASLCGADAVLDGELVCLTDGRPDFDRVSARGLCTGRTAARRALSDPAVLIVWDVLRLGGQDLRSQPWLERRRALENLGLSGDPAGAALAITAVCDDVPALLQATFDLRLEGIVAKWPSSTYRSGLRCNDWIKVKHPHARDLQLPRRSLVRSA